MDNFIFSQNGNTPFGLIYYYNLCTLFVFILLFQKSNYVKISGEIWKECLVVPMFILCINGES
ncbi:hypothetical protein NCCP28_38000 [Niallia sp. NCCP-28]|nr:hypothetical protein NCCP28_38000 [Niallia sp. NCCP-28]